MTPFLLIQIHGYRMFIVPHGKVCCCCSLCLALSTCSQSPMSAFGDVRPAIDTAEVLVTCGSEILPSEHATSLTTDDNGDDNSEHAEGSIRAA